MTERNMADPLNWPDVPGPRIADVEFNPHMRCAQCEFVVYPFLTLYADSSRAYIRHYYREHMYRNWSA